MRMLCRLSKTGRTTVFLKTRDQSKHSGILKIQRSVIINKDNPNYDTTNESNENPGLVPITDRQGINNEC